MFVSTDRCEKLLKFASNFGLKFDNIELLNSAFVHSSFINEKGLTYSDCYERLEFLGDAVLKIVISDFLFSTFLNANEGELTNLRSTIVSDKELSVLAAKINLQELLVLGPNEEKTGGRNKASILACAFEAFLGAIYLEYKQLGLKACYDFMIDNFKETILSIQNYNYKAILQEFTQSDTHTLPIYKVLDEKGLSHNKTYEIGVYYNGSLIAKASGKSKKEAEQLCAKNAIECLNIKIV